MCRLLAVTRRPARSTSPTTCARSRRRARAAASTRATAGAARGGKTGAWRTYHSILPIWEDGLDRFGERARARGARPQRLPRRGHRGREQHAVRRRRRSPSSSTASCAACGSPRPAGSAPRSCSGSWSGAAPAEASGGRADGRAARRAADALRPRDELRHRRRRAGSWSCSSFNEDDDYFTLHARRRGGADGGLFRAVRRATPAGRRSPTARSR